MSNVAQIYHSRESRIAEVNDPANQCQFEDVDEDVERIKEASGALFDYVDNLDTALSDYLETLTERPVYSTPSRVGSARRELIENWALTQATLSKLAWVLHIDGNEAYQRLINALKSETTVDMNGL